ncbi:MAG TPA: hypothetical protein VMY37_10315 [Thermoguttaceae bacterium]|nr:hypothetical protein [Thermoguttaceae bacterium]
MPTRRNAAWAPGSIDPNVKRSWATDVWKRSGAAWWQVRSLRATETHHPANTGRDLVDVTAHETQGDRP